MKKKVCRYCGIKKHAGGGITAHETHCGEYQSELVKTAWDYITDKPIGIVKADNIEYVCEAPRG